MRSDFFGILGGVFMGSSIYDLVVGDFERSAFFGLAACVFLIVQVIVLNKRLEKK